MSKSFTGTALGLMIGEGKLSLDDLVIDHLPEYFADADPAFDALTIRHIASMATGHMAETLGFAKKACPENIVKGSCKFLRAAQNSLPITSRRLSR